MTETASRILVRGLGARGHADLPDAVRERATALLPDYLAVASYGSRTDTGRIAYRTAVDLSGAMGSATAFGHYAQLNTDAAAFVNATAAHSIEFDDIDVTSYLHYGAPVASAALAIAEREHADGRSLIAAIAAGCELMARLNAAMNPNMRDRGFHTTTALGPFGGALAAGLLLGLDEDGLVSALAYAGAQASGLMEIYGATMQKRFNPGFAARNAVVAALLAANGAIGEETVLEGAGGFGKAFAGGLDLHILLDGLGVIERAQIELKPYACVRPIHSALDAAIALRNTYAIRPAEIASVTVHRPSAWASYFLTSQPRSRHEAQVSLPYAVAAAVVYGDGVPARFDIPADPEVMRLAELVVAVTDDTLEGELASRVDIRLVDGTVFTETRAHPRGGASLPLSELERRAKARTLMEPVYGVATEGLVDRIFGVADVPDIATLLGSLRVAVSGHVG